MEYTIETWRDQEACGSDCDWDARVASEGVTGLASGPTEEAAILAALADLKLELAHKGAA